MFRRISGLILALLISGAAAPAQWRFNFISFDFPDAKATGACGINANGAVVGQYADSAGKLHGFLLRDGTYTTIDYPGAATTNGVCGINSQGDMVGFISTPGLPGDGNRGFLLQQGAFTDVNFPGHMNTVAMRINDQGQIVGCYHDADQMTSMHGMMFSNGNFSELSLLPTMNNGLSPDGSLAVGFYAAAPTCRNVFVGIGCRGYVASSDSVALFDFPFSIGTVAWDINDSGEVVGVYTDAAKKTHGFLLRLGLAIDTFGLNPQIGMTGPFDFVSIDFPGATRTNATGINSRGEIVGLYVDAAGKQHGFLLTGMRRRWERSALPEGDPEQAAR